MKKVAIAILIICVSVLAGCSCGCGSGKYYIKDSNGYIWSTNQYEEDSAKCVKFLPTGDNEKEVKICGTYVIQENKNWKPEEEKTKKSED